MGLELSILGIRKIKDEEIKELTGKTRIEMENANSSGTFSRTLRMIRGIGLIPIKRFQRMTVIKVSSICSLP